MPDLERERRTTSPGGPEGRPLDAPLTVERPSHVRPDRAILAFASAQHGVVTRSQVVDAGISPTVLDRRVRAGLMRPLHRGVYLVGPLMPPEASAMAAVLACGDHAAVSHRSATALWLMAPIGECSPPIDVLLSRGDRRRPGIRIHRVAAIEPDEVMVRDGIPITTPARTLLDLAAVGQVREVERAIVEASAKRLVSHAELRGIAERHVRHAGSARLRALIGSGPPRLVRSEAEKRFLALVRRARLDTPEVNVRVAGFEVDFFWRAERLVVEIDGLAFHSTAGRFEVDRRRDIDLASAGVRVMRVTWSHLSKEPEALLVRLGKALACAEQPIRSRVARAGTESRVPLPA